MALKNKHLRSGYTTGACAAATAKAATLILLKAESGMRHAEEIRSVEIPFPDGSRVSFRLHRSSLITQNSSLIARVSVIKDAGDDPDVTHKAEIMAEVRVRSAECGVRKEEQNALVTNSSLIIKGGKGVGIVTKPGLQITVGEAAINPVPRKMITEAVMEAIADSYKLQVTSCKSRNANIENSSLVTRHAPLSLEITISVPEGERLAKRTLNARLGIMGGISILGTTGIVRPLSSEAWTASITAAMDVAKAMGRDEVVLSSGRASERIHMEKYKLPVEAYVMMGDYIEFSLIDAVKHGFKKIHLCSQWAKMLKVAMATPQTHVRHGAIDMRKTVQFLNQLGINVTQELEFNTAREIHDLLLSTFEAPETAFLKVCAAAKEYAEKITGGIPVITNLVLYNGDILVIGE